MKRSTGRAGKLSALIAFLVPLPMFSCTAPSATLPETTIPLERGWRIAASGEVDATGEAVSTPGFDSQAWTEATVPTTVMAALVRSGAVREPYFAKTLETIGPERFRQPWWYRTEFSIDGPPAEAASLVFEGINYSAEVWLNGHKAAGREDLLGAFRMFEIDVTEHFVPGANALAVLVHPPQPGDPTIGFVDWNPTSPDRNMGLWRGVTLRRTGAVSLGGVFVRSDVDLETLNKASLAVRATLRNHSDQEAIAVVKATISGGIEVEHAESLEPGEERDIELASENFEQLIIENPRLWWPHTMGEPNLYELLLSVSVDGRPADAKRVTFGIRQVDDYTTEDGHRGYAVNGKKILIRGGGWVDDMMLADDDRRIEDQIRYVRHMNLNTIRLEGFWGTSHELYDLADRYGILVIVGWSCQWEWESYLGGPVDEFGGIDTPEEMNLIARSLRDQVVWLRNHPSVLVWALASDMLPRPELEKKYYAELSSVDPTRPTLVSCAAGTSEVSGPSGVKMNGPYDWVSPNYWYLDEERGGAYGFNTETGPGPQPPPLESIQRMLPRENWWPIDEMWSYHCGRGVFRTLNRYREALEARYGPVTGLEDFARKAQIANYEGMRAMFESFSIRRPKTTGIIQWMLNSAWPEMYWQLYDYYLVPNGAFYGARDGSRPINVAYDYADRDIVVVNDTAAQLDDAAVRIRVYDLESKLLYDDQHTLDVPAETIRRLTALPAVSTEGKTYFVDARLTSEDGSELAKSLYWLSTEDDLPDWDASEWFVTPLAEYADLTGIATMPEVDLEVEHRFESTADGYEIDVSLANPSDKLAFFVELRILGAESGRRAAPVLWSENYVSLLPGETRQIHGTLPAHALAGEAPVFRYGGHDR